MPELKSEIDAAEKDADSTVLIKTQGIICIFSGHLGTLTLKSIFVDMLVCGATLKREITHHYYCDLWLLYGNPSQWLSQGPQCRKPSLCWFTQSSNRVSTVFYM